MRAIRCRTLALSLLPALAGVTLLGAASAAVMYHHVTGTVFYRERIALPPQARIWVSLRDVGAGDAPAKLIAHTLIRPHPPHTQVPIPFDIAYDPAQIIATHGYAVRSSIIIDGQTRWTSNATYPVITHGHPTEDVNILVVAAGPAAAAPASTLESQPWVVASVGSHSYASEAIGSRPTVEFDAAHQRVSGFSGCNNFTGSYQRSGQTLHIGTLASTLMACISGKEDDRAFLGAVQSATSYSIEGHTLTLYAKGAAIATFVPKPTV